MNRYRANRAWIKALEAEDRRWQSIAVLLGIGIGIMLGWLMLLLLYVMLV